MSVTEDLVKLLSRKKGLATSFEAVTADMLYEENSGVLMQMVERREQILEQMSGLDDIIRATCEGDKDLLDALNHRSNRGGLDQNLGKIYDASMEVKAVLNRLQNGNEAIVEHLMNVKANLKEKIEEVNSSSHSVAQKYHKAVMTAITKGPMHEKDREKKI